jgi:hypothetical protein
MSTKKESTDTRPRFGWTSDLDNEPQVIFEEKSLKSEKPVVVIPLPYVSAKLRRKVREFVNGTLWPKE